MNGKKIKVIEYELKFGQKIRMVNVFGVFKYKENNNLYVVFADVDTNYSYVSYGGSHIKNNTILSMSCNKDKDEEIIKEYIFKVTKGEELTDFEIIPLDNVDGIEIITSNNLEIKREVMDKLIELTIPKKEKVNKEPVKKAGKKRGVRSSKILLLMLLIIILGVIFYFYTKLGTGDNSVAKNIVCTKTYSHKELDNVSVNEEKTFEFNNSDILLKVDVIMMYKFNNEDDYLEFINKALYYKYMPDNSDTLGGWKKDDNAHTFKMTEKINIDEDYNEPTDYEEILATAKKDGYTCNENIEK